MTKPEGNNEFGKYEKEFSRLMKEAVAKHAEENAEPLNIDYSFLNEYENVKISTTKKRSTARSFARVAVILIVFFCGISVAMVTDLPTNASAWKAQMARRLYVLKEGFVSSDPDVSMNFTDENTTKIVIDDFEKIEKARNVAPGLPIPKYVPDGYQSEKFTADVTYSGTYKAIYEFMDSENCEFLITIYYNPEIDNLGMVVDNVIETINLEECTIYLWQNSLEDSYGVVSVCQDYTANIIGDISSEEMIIVSKELE